MLRDYKVTRGLTYLKSLGSSKKITNNIVGNTFKPTDLLTLDIIITNSKSSEIFQGNLQIRQFENVRWTTIPSSNIVLLQDIIITNSKSLKNTARYLQKLKSWTQTENAWI